MRYLEEIIKEQNAALKKAVETIDALREGLDVCRGALDVAHARLAELKARPIPASDGHVNIKALLTFAGISQAALARELGVNRGTVSEIVTGAKVSARIRRHIARALGVSVSDLWPNRRRVA